MGSEGGDGVVKPIVNHIEVICTQALMCEEGCPWLIIVFSRSSEIGVICAAAW